MLHIVSILVALLLVCVSYLNTLRGEVDHVSYALAKASFQIFPTTFPRNDSVDPDRWRARFKTVSTISLSPVHPTSSVDVYHDGVVEGDFRLLRIYNGNVGATDTLKDVLVFYFGGGFVLGGVDENDELCRLFAKYTDFVVVAVQYSLAPEHPFPRGFNDTMAGLRWVRDNIAEHGGNPERIFISGESAGGNLAAAVTAHNLDTDFVSEDNRVSIIGALLVYPGTSGNYSLPSFITYANYSGILTTNIVKHALALYSGGTPCTPEQYTCLPMYIPDRFLAQFPPAVFVVAEYDVLRDDSLLLMERMQALQVPVTLSHYRSTIHGFFGRELFPEGINSIKQASAKLLEMAKRNL